MEFVMPSFGGGMNLQKDPTRIGKDEYPILINGRNRYDDLQPIKSPLEIGLPVRGKIQGVYAAGTYALVFIAGNAYYRNYLYPASAFVQIAGFQMSPDAQTLWAELVPASTVNFQRVATGATANGAVNLTTAVSGSPSCVVVQDGVSQPFLIFPDGTARKAKSYDLWKVDDREYVPIGRQMLFQNGILYLVSKDGTAIYHSVSGRPLDFVVQVTTTADKISNDEPTGGAGPVSHRVGFDEITCLAPLNSPDLAFFVSTARNSYRVVPDFASPIYGEPQFDNVPLFQTGCLNNFSFSDILGDSTFIDYTGIRSFNAVLQVRNEGKNAPFSAMVYTLFKDVIQTQPCVGKFDNYAMYGVQTIYGPAVLIYDEIIQKFVGLDMFNGVGQVRQFAEIKTDSARKLLFFTSDDRLYEYNAGNTATMQAYIGEFCSQDPNVEQKPMKVRIVLADARESGALGLVPFIDRKRMDGLASIKTITASLGADTIPRAVPFGNSDSDTVKNFTISMDQAQSGWKLGLLLTLNCDARISHLSISSADETADTSMEQEASDNQEFMAA